MPPLPSPEQLAREHATRVCLERSHARGGYLGANAEADFLAGWAAAQIFAPVVVCTPPEASSTPEAPSAPTEASTPEASTPEASPPALEQTARVIVGVDLGVRARDPISEWVHIRAKDFAAKAPPEEDSPLGYPHALFLERRVDLTVKLLAIAFEEDPQRDVTKVLDSMGRLAFGAGYSTGKAVPAGPIRREERSHFLRLIDEMRKGAAKRERRVLKALRRLVEREG